MKQTVQILGTEYEIVRDTHTNDKCLEKADGYCDFTTKRIVIENDVKHYEWGDMETWFNNIVRHEIVHAFMFESGLDVCSDWGRNEELVDWIALQIPKMAKAIEDAKRR